MITLVEFIEARLAEDEQASKRIRHAPMHGVESPAELDYLRFADPDRVLREVEGKRRIIAAADEASGLDMQVDGEFRVGRRDEVAEPYVGDVILRALALPYAGHPDYRAEWAL